MVQFRPLIRDIYFIKNSVAERGREGSILKVGLLRSHISTFLAKIIWGNRVNELELSFGEAPFFLQETFSRLRSNLHHYSFWVLSKMYNIPWKNILNYILLRNMNILFRWMFINITNICSCGGYKGCELPIIAWDRPHLDLLLRCAFFPYCIGYQTIEIMHSK